MHHSALNSILDSIYFLFIVDSPANLYIRLFFYYCAMSIDHIIIQHIKFVYASMLMQNK